MKKFVPIVLIALTLVCCGRRSRVIPAATLSDIYVDMFMADQWVAQNSRARKTADTSNFYAPIFDKYGYTVEDYDASVKHYLRKPDKYAKILKAAGAKMSRKAKRLEAIEDAIAKRVKFSPYVPVHFRYDTLRFRDDTLGLWPNDSSFRVADTLALADSLAARDSLSVALDTLAVPADSLAVKDTIINNQSYGQEKRLEKVFLLHGSDDLANRRYPDLREGLSGKGEPTR